MSSLGLLAKPTHGGHVDGQRVLLEFDPFHLGDGITDPVTNMLGDDDPAHRTTIGEVSLYPSLVAEIWPTT